MACGVGSRQVINYNFGRANNLRSFPIATLNHFQNGVVGLSRIVTLRKRLMPVRVERFANYLPALDTVLKQQLLQLFQRHLHALMKLRRIPRRAGGQRAFEIVNDWQQLDYE
jgi:hypothetical protein